MKKKIIYFMMLIAITVFQFGPLMATTVKALDYDLTYDIPGNATGYNSYNVTSNVVTLYVGNISVDGASTLKYLYSDKSVNTKTLDEIKKILPSDYQAILPTTEGQIATSNDNTVNVNDAYTDAGPIAANLYPTKFLVDTSSTILYNQTQYNNLVDASKAEVANEATAEANNLSEYNARKTAWNNQEQAKVDLDSNYTPVAFPEEYVHAFNDNTTYPTGNYFIADTKTNNGVSYIIRNGVVTEIENYNINRTIVKVVNTSADLVSNPNIVHADPVTIYHTKVTGSLQITGTDTFNNNYSSGDDYIAGNTTDTDVVAAINQIQNDINSDAADLNVTPSSIAKGITDYYYDVHDEFEVDGSTITITTILDKYQNYKISATGTAKNIKRIDINLTAPYANDEVTLTEITDVICLNTGGCYNPSLRPTVTTTTSHLEIGSLWVNNVTPSLGGESVEYFEGTFSKDQTYRAYIYLTAKDGWKINNDVDIYVNGQPAESIFSVTSNNTEVSCVMPIVAEARMARYNLTADDGNQISFIEEEGQILTFNSLDIYSLTDEMLEEIAQAEDLSVDEVKTMLNDILNKVKIAVQGNGKILKVLNVSVTDGTNEIHQVNGGFKIRIKLTDDIKGYDVYKLQYVDDNYQATESPIYLTINDGYLEGVLPHLSGYVLLGENNPSNTINPNTGDNLLLYISLLGISIVSFVGAGIYTKKKLLNKQD